MKFALILTIGVAVVSSFTVVNRDGSEYDYGFDYGLYDGKDYSGSEDFSGDMRFDSGSGSDFSGS